MQAVVLPGATIASNFPELVQGFLLNNRFGTIRNSSYIYDVRHWDDPAKYGRSKAQTGNITYINYHINV
jgi:hypothetical protein